MLRQFLIGLAAFAMSSVSSAQLTEYDYSYKFTQTYYFVDRGPFDNGFVSGEEFERVQTLTSWELLSAPANPLPAVLLFSTTHTFSVSSSGVVVALLGGYGTADDGLGNQLSWTVGNQTISQASDFKSGTFTSTNTYTFGAGGYEGVYGFANVEGAYDNRTLTQSGIATVELGTSQSLLDTLYNVDNKTPQTPQRFNIPFNI